MHILDRARLDCDIAQVTSAILSPVAKMPVTACAALTAPTVCARQACARRTCVAAAARADVPAKVALPFAVLSGRRGVALSLAGLAATVQVSQPALAAAPSAPGVGDAAPAFELPSTKGGALSLSGLLSSGKYLVLYFYNADGTTGCSLEAQRFQQALPALEAAGAQLVGVSMDDLSKHTEFCSDKKLTFPLLSDKTGDVSASYGAGACLSAHRNLLPPRPDNLPTCALSIQISRFLSLGDVRSFRAFRDPCAY